MLVVDAFAQLLGHAAPELRSGRMRGETSVEGGARVQMVAWRENRRSPRDSHGSAVAMTDSHCREREGRGRRHLRGGESMRGEGLPRS